MRNSLFLLITFVFAQLNSQILKETGNFDFDKKNINENKDKLEKISFEEYSSYSEQFQKLIYEHLSKQKKLNLWSDRLQSAIDEKNDEFSKELSKLKILLSEYYNDKVSLSTFESAVQSLVKSYGKDQVGYIVTQMKKGRGKIVSLDVGIAPQYPDKPNTIYCNCSQVSDWCSSSSFCKSWPCETSSGGCGTLWVYNCNGRCFAPNN